MEFHLVPVDLSVAEADYAPTLRGRQRTGAAQARGQLRVLLRSPSRLRDYERPRRTGEREADLLGQLVVLGLQWLVSPEPLEQGT